MTYRCQEDQCLLQVPEILDLFIADALWNTLDEGVKVLESVLAEDRLHDVLVNLLGGVLGQATLLGGS